MDSRVCMAFSLLVCITLIVALLIGIFPKVYKVYEERQLFIDEQFELFDSWNRIPLKQQQRFYFYNITNDLESLLPGVPIRMEEIGPFVYDAEEHDGLRWNSTNSLNYVSFRDMKFLLSNSVASESSTLYTLNVPLIRSLRSNGLGVKFNKSSRNAFRKNMIHKTTIREMLLEIIDGFSLMNSTLLNKSKVGGKEQELAGGDYDYDDYSEYLPKNPKDYFEKELCVEVFSIFRIVNAPVYTDGSVASVFEGIPCKCLKFLFNGTEIIQKTYPKDFSLNTKLYQLLWDAKACTGIVSRESSVKRRSADKSLFLISSHKYFGDEDYIEYNRKSKAEVLLGQSHINVEPMSEVVTDLTFKYQFNIPIKYIDDADPWNDVQPEVYPVLLTDIVGTSKQQIDYSIFHYIVFPKLFTRDFLPKVIVCTGCVLGIVCISTFALVWFPSRRGDPRERMPLLDRSQHNYI